MSSTALHIAAARPATTPPPDAGTAAKPGAEGVRAWQGDRFSFGDVLDIVNPLQHIPLLNRVYREITGDGIGTASKIAGGTLFGGIVGLAASLADTVLEQATGESAAGHVLAALDDGPGAAQRGPDADHAGGTDVAEITGQDGSMDLALAYEEGGRWGLQMALADTAARAASQTAAGPAPAAAAPVATAISESAPKARRIGVHGTPHAAAQPTPMQPLATRAAAVDTRGLPASLPPPEVLAANPELIARTRNAAGNAAWLQLMQAARDNGGAGSPASATVARALSAYGAAAR